ncbi:MATE family efflux transporter [Halobacillus yeomjeoni]|uniref:MATE family efflux transporter n=1 Tax=Halobacillus yeomjeoni TaxID=311194 RepID=UPI001CD64F13|nr:MATE family efflux transporter [Halobacillus yeomjeoni]MCA0984311.1 MATE family efflux transporter [Halobacillus yeomjeoni]
MDQSKNMKLTLGALTIPIFLELLLGILIQNVDLFMLSKYHEDAVAAIGAANRILLMVIVMFGFIGSGTTIVLSRMMGAGQSDDAEEAAVVSLVANSIIGVLFSLLLWQGAGTFLNFMDLTPNVHSMAEGYLKVVGGFLFLQAVILTINAILKSHGHTKQILYASIMMNLINVFGNYILIFGQFGLEPMGTDGAALSTVVARLITSVALYFILIKTIGHALPFARLLSMPSAHLKKILSIGIPSAGEYFTYLSAQFVVFFFITTMGTQSITTQIYVQTIMELVFIISTSLANGTKIIIGHHIGAKRYGDAYKQCIQSFKWGAVFTITATLFLWMLSKPIIGLFTESTTVQSGFSLLLLMAVVFEPARMFYLIGINALRAVGDARYTFYVAAIFMWGIGVPLSYALGVHFSLGLVGIWMAFILDEWIRGVVIVRRWRSRSWVHPLKQNLSA